MAFISFIEGENYLLTRGNGLPATCYFLLSTRAVSSMTPTNTLAGGIGEITGTGYGRQSQIAPIPQGGIVTFTSVVWATGSNANWPSNVASVALATTINNTGVLICAWDLTAVRNLAQAGATETCNLSFSLASGSGVLPPPSAPTVTSLSVTSGSTAGGTQVIITGTNFSGATSVSFDGTAVAFTVNNATTITTTSPSYPSGGVVDVTVTTSAGTSAITASDKFTYTQVVTGTYDSVILNNPSGAPVLYMDGTTPISESGTGTFTISNINTVTTSATLPNGDSALLFNGSSNYIYIADPANGTLSFPGTNAITYEFWMQLGTQNMPHDSGMEGGTNILGKSVDTSSPNTPGNGCEYQFRYFNQDGTNTNPSSNYYGDVCGYAFNGSCGLGAGFDDHIDTNPSNSNTANNRTKTTSMWLYYAVVYTAANVRLYGGIYGDSYWRGQLLNTAPMNAGGNNISPIHTTSPLTIGSCGWGTGQFNEGSVGFFQGKIGKFAFYDRALSATEIQSHYNAMSGGGGGGSAPTITSISPTSGPTTGNTAVTITGTNLTSPTGANFGLTAGTGVVGVSPTSARATSPAHTAGIVDVTITTANGTSGTSSADQFTYTGTSSSYDSTILGDSPAFYLTNTLTAGGSAGPFTVTPHGSTNSTTVALPNGDLAWNFDNSNTQYLSVPGTSTALSIGSGMSVEFWLRYTSANQPNGASGLNGGVNVLGKSDYDTGCEWEFRYYDGNSTDGGNDPYNCCFYAFDSGCGIGDGYDDHLQPKVAGTWYYFCGTYTGSTIVMYARARGGSAFTNSAPRVTSSSHTSTLLTIGCTDYNATAASGDLGRFYGAIGKLAIYNTVLSTAQKNAHFAAMG